VNSTYRMKLPKKTVQTLNRVPQCCTVERRVNRPVSQSHIPISETRLETRLLRDLRVRVFFESLPNFPTNFFALSGNKFSADFSKFQDFFKDHGMLCCYVVNAHYGVFDLPINYPIIGTGNQRNALLTVSKQNLSPERQFKE